MANKYILTKCCYEDVDESEMYGAYKIFFGTLVSEPRLKMINLLRKGKKNVGEICAHLKMEQTDVSHNLARLKECGFVNAEVSGRFRYYSLNKKTIEPLMKLIDRHMSKNCIHILRKIRGGGEMKKIKITIEGMHCASCGGNVEKSVEKVDGVKEVQVSVMTKKGVIMAEDSVSDEKLKEAVLKAGYKVVDIK